MGVALRGRPEAQGDDLGLLPAVEQFGNRRVLALLAVEGPLEALEHAAAAHVLDRGGAAATGLGDLGIDPGIGAVGVGE